VGALLRLSQLRRRHRQVHTQQEVLLQENLLPAVQGEVDQRAGSAAGGQVVDGREVTRGRGQQLDTATPQPQEKKIDTPGRDIKPGPG